MKVDLLAYLIKNLKPDQELDLTNEVLEYIKEVESDALQSKLDIATKALEEIAGITGCSEEQGQACAGFMNETAQTALSQIKDK